MATRASNYDKLPTVHISNDDSACRIGWAEIVQELSSRFAGGERAVIVAECYPGVDVEEIRRGLAELAGKDKTAILTIIFAERALKLPAELSSLLAPWLGDDPVFGRMRQWELDRKSVV